MVALAKNREMPMIAVPAVLCLAALLAPVLVQSSQQTHPSPHNAAFHLIFQSWHQPIQPLAANEFLVVEDYSRLVDSGWLLDLAQRGPHTQVNMILLRSEHAPPFPDAAPVESVFVLTHARQLDGTRAGQQVAKLMTSKTGVCGFHILSKENGMFKVSHCQPKSEPSKSKHSKTIKLRLVSAKHGQYAVNFSREAGLGVRVPDCHAHGRPQLLGCVSTDGWLSA